MGRMTDKVAIVTGAASGIGRACAERLAVEGARVVLGDIDRAGGEAAARAIGDAAWFASLDVTREADWEAAFGATLERHGGLDVVVNSAGIDMSATVEEQTLADWRRTIEVNLTGTFLGIKHAMTATRETGGGSIVNLGSICSRIGWATVPAYCASKGGVLSLTRASALSGAKFGVRMNAVLPGFIWTPMTSGFYERKFGATETAQAELAKRHPIGRVGWSEDVAAAVLYLASEEASFVTGTELAVDGGFLAE